VDNDGFISTAEAARLLKVSLRVVRGAIRRGDIKAKKVGKCYRIILSSIYEPMHEERVSQEAA
jgi:excisionase family DNA binding protein